MCIIIVKQKGKSVSRSTLKTSSKINPHNLGVVWLDTFEVSYHKSKDWEVLDTHRPYIAHFRYATIGKINKENTHPFVCGQNKNEVLMMNGTIHGMGNIKECDTKILAKGLGGVSRHLWKDKLSNYNCRFVSINLKHRTFQIYNKELWTHKEGVWYSKDNVLQDNLIAVYGTLKKGYSNYHRYLTNSKYVGSGNTQDKYPLVIQGLPYMVNQKGVGYNVDVDIFRVSDTILKDIDRLEGHPNWYKRIQVPITTKKNKKTLICWIYFNPQRVDNTSKLYKTYTQNNRIWSGYKVNSYKPTSFNWSKVTPIDEVEINRDNELRDLEEVFSDTPYCAECLHDLEFDSFNSYHCNGCGSWFSETEVLTNNL
tara:strand:- start:1234 stop:2334 length:1101 start_codon:yes stop_codon:yes gene_type:complete